MAIKIINTGNTGYRGTVRTGIYEILTDAESDITSLGETIVQDGCTYLPSPGSIAYTADLSVAYQLSPSGVWTKTV